MPRESSICRLSNANGDIFFGWHMLHSSIEKQIRKKSDVLVAFAHFALIKLTKARCIGIGSNQSDLTGTPTDMLPTEWSRNSADGISFALRYKLHNKLYLLLGLTHDNQYLVLNLLEASSQQTSSVAFNLNATVRDLQAPVQHLLFDTNTVMERLRKELIEPVVNSKAKDETTQTIGSKLTKTNRTMSREPRTIDAATNLQIVGRSIAQRERARERQRARSRSRAVFDEEALRRYVILPPRLHSRQRSAVRFGSNLTTNASGDSNLLRENLSSDEVD